MFRAQRPGHGLSVPSLKISSSVRSLLVAMPFAPSSFLLLVVRPGANAQNFVRHFKTLSQSFRAILCASSFCVGTLWEECEGRVGAAAACSLSQEMEWSIRLPSLCHPYSLSSSVFFGHTYTVFKRVQKLQKATIFVALRANQNYVINQNISGHGTSLQSQTFSQQLPLLCAEQKAPSTVRPLKHAAENVRCHRPLRLLRSVSSVNLRATKEEHC